MTTVRVIALALVAPIAIGCNQGSSQIRPKAAAELQCPESEIKVRTQRRTQAQRVYADIAETPEHKLASGCGRVAMYVIQCPPGASKKSGSCDWLSVNELKTEHLLRRASYDMQCDPKQLQLTWLDRLSTGVSGCGHRLTYVLNCPHSPDLWSQQCTWVLNTDSFRQGAGMHPPPPQPAPAPAPAPHASVPPPPTTTPAPAAPVTNAPEAEAETPTP